ncbi:MAG TPA: tetratricopeptide repeat protein [Mycobacteriales bacterium]
MRGQLRAVAVAAGVALLAAVLLLGGGALLRPATGTGAPPPTATATATAGQDLGAAVARAQQRLRDVPADYTTWAELGLAYVQQARITADPTYYPRAEGALRRSLAVHPADNAPARVGLGALAAGRHDFAGALTEGRRALAIDPYDSAAYGVVGDALVELGRYDEAYRAIQRMVDLAPGTSSYARASYTWELRGDVSRARQDFQLALDVAPSPDDAGFALYYLGELAWNAGDLRTARSRYDEGLRRAPAYLPLREGQAKVLAAEGRTADAVAVYRSLVARLPQPSYVIELGDLLAATGDRAGADQQYALVRAEERILAANGVDVDLELALFEADHGHPAAALAAARKTYTVRRGILAEDALAWALHAAGRDAEALPHARAAERLGYRSASLRYHLGMIERALGDRTGSRRDLGAALEINPHFSALQAPVAHRTLAGLR